MADNARTSCESASKLDADSQLAPDAKLPAPMSVPLSGNAQSLVGEHPAAGIAELAAELNAKEFIVVDELWVDNATREVSNNGPVIVGRRSERS